MLTLTHTIKERRARRGREHRHPTGRLGLVFSAILSLLFIFFAIALLWGYLGVTRDLPSLDTLTALLEPPQGILREPTRLYDRTGTHVLLELQDPAASGNQYLRVASSTEVPGETFAVELVDATIATVEPGFWDSPGYTLAGIVEGTHPTLAQRLVSDLLLWDEAPSLQRNFRERLLAAQLIDHYGHEKVLEWYLNSAHYGPLIYGADAAARAYFGKPASNLSLAEAALLAAAAEAPGISPVDAPQVVLERQKTVIQSMLLQGLVDVTQAVQAEQETISFREAVETEDMAPAFTNLVLEQLSPYIPRERLERGGLMVITTLDYDLQLQASCATSVYLARLKGMPVDETTMEGKPCESARLLPGLLAEIEGASENLAASAVILEPQTGHILAMVGQAAPGLDPAHQPGHPAGSLLTPMIYLTSFTRGFSPSSLVWDVPDSSDSSQAIGEGNNAQLAGEIYHGPVRLRIALANDYLNPARQVMQQVGADNVWRTSRELGLLSLGQTPPSVLSMDDYFSTPVTLLEVTQVFGVIDNHGVLAGQDLGGAGGNGNTTLNPTSVIRMLGVDGREWLDWSSTKSKPILSTQLAYLIHHVLSDETARWPSLGHPNLLEIGRPAGAKLGGSEEGQDAWTVGYVPQMVVSSWVGSVGDEQSQIPPEIAAGLWRALIQYATRDLPAQNWDVPAGISMVDVCDPSGLLPTETCPTVVKEVFLTGSEPTQADHLYQKIQVNRETGNLATVFTPPELVEERVYLVVPPQAMEWAKSAGLPIPPDSYDVIYVPPPTSADVQITAPAMFAHVSGEVSITGHASGKSFSFYRLQVGQGLNPQEWIQVGEDVKTPVEDGLLGVWDASGLSGLYVIQLLVVSQDQRVENNILQVTVDNQPPEVSILSPSDGEQIKYLMGKMIAFQVEADDDLELARVEFYVDDELLVTMVQPPFTILWEAEQGSHTLHVQVYDLAGNMAEKTVTFEVKR